MVSQTSVIPVLLLSSARRQGDFLDAISNFSLPTLPSLCSLPSKCPTVIRLSSSDTKPPISAVLAGRCFRRGRDEGVEKGFHEAGSSCADGCFCCFHSRQLTLVRTFRLASMRPSVSKSKIVLPVLSLETGEGRSPCGLIIRCL